MKNLRKISYLSLLLLACNPEEISLPAWNAQFLLPLAKGSFSMADIQLGKDVRTETDESGFVTLVATGTRPKIKIGDKLKIRNQTFHTNFQPFRNYTFSYSFDAQVSLSDIGFYPPYPVEVPPFTAEPVRQSISIEKVDYALIQSGSFQFSLENNFPFPLEAGLSIKLFNISDQSVFYSFVLPSPLFPGDSFKLQPAENLSGRRVEGNLEVLIENLESRGNPNASFEGSTGLKLSAELLNLRFSEARLDLTLLRTLATTETFTLEVPWGAELANFSINSGKVDFLFKNVPSYPLKLQATLLSATRENLPLSAEISLDQSTEYSLILDEYFFDLRGRDNNSYNTFDVSFNLSLNQHSGFVTLYFNEEISIDISLLELKPRSIEGYMGVFEEVVYDSVSLPYFSNVVEGEFLLRNPSIQVTTQNDIGVPAQLPEQRDSLFFKGVNPRLRPGAESMLTSVSDLYVPPANYLGDVQSFVYRVDKSSDPTFEDFVAFLPSKIYYAIPYKIGSEEVNYNQFAIDTSGINTLFEFHVPLEFRAQNLVLTDTFAVSFDIDNPAREIVNAQLNFFTENYFPISFQLQTYFLDSSYQVIDSAFLNTRIIQPGKKNAAGQIESPTLQSFSISIDTIRWGKIKNSKAIRPQFILNTLDTESQKVYSTNTILFQISGEVQVHIKP